MVAVSTSDAVERAAARLLYAVHNHVTVPPIRDLIGADDVGAAYAVQQKVTRAWEREGGVVVGRKIGLTSAAVQRQLNVNQPDFGVLFADMDVSGAAVIPLSSMLQPRAEAEIAFVLAEDLVDGDLDVGRVREAIGYAVAAVELVDSRIEDWDIALTDTVADNASSGFFVLAERPCRLDEFAPREVRMRMYDGEELVSEGDGTDCLGDPLAAVLWLARTAREYGEPLRAGQIILSGALGPVVPVRAGSTIRADIEPLGSVSVEFA
ncbi:2-keto-4-pentenoate hydratase [Nocardia gipuzkoensis]